MTHHEHWNDFRYAEAIEAKSFKSLLPYPCLLFRWQKDHSVDVISIARIASHKTTHKSCGEKCRTIDIWMKKVLIQSLGIILNKRANSIDQLSLI